jgi:uncharacterized membrane protein YfcA
MNERSEKLGLFVFGLALGSVLTFLVVTDVASAYWRGLREVRWEVWAIMAPFWLAGGIAGYRMSVRRRRMLAQA